jgi:hypothetical protein
MGITALKIK